MFFGSFDVFMHVFKNVIYKDVKTCFFYVFYLLINVFNIYELNRATVSVVISLVVLLM